MNADRIYAICREAAEQSDRLNVPAIGLPVSLADFVDVFPKDRAAIVCAEWGDATDIQTALASSALKKCQGRDHRRPRRRLFRRGTGAITKLPNASFIRLGPRILRADTAAISALACWQSVQGDWKSKV